MTDWSGIMAHEERLKRREFSKALMESVGEDCLTRKPRDPEKRKIMARLGLPDKFPEVQYPSPGNTPDDLYSEDI